MASKNKDTSTEIKAWTKSYDDKKRSRRQVGLLEAVYSCMENTLKEKGIDSFASFWKWGDIVGKDIAARAFFSKIAVKKNGEAVLFLAVKSDAVVLEMSYQKDMIIKKANAFWGKNKITDVKFVVDPNVWESHSLSDDKDVLLYQKHLKKLDDIAKKDLNNKIENVDGKERLEKALTDLRSCIVGGVFE